MAQLPIHKRSIPFVAVLGLLILGGATTGTVHGQWTSIGPDGGWVEVVVIDPETPSTLYAATQRGGVFKSSDAGASWTGMSNGIPVNLNLQIREMHIDPLTPETLYLATNGGVFKSTNGAHSWALMNEGLTDTVIRGMAVDPSNPSTLYAGSSFRGVFKSTDAAESWTKVLDITTKADVLAVAPSNSSIVYLGASINTVYRAPMPETPGICSAPGSTTPLFSTRSLSIRPTRISSMQPPTAAFLRRPTAGPAGPC